MLINDIGQRLIETKQSSLVVLLCHLSVSEDCCLQEKEINIIADLHTYLCNLLLSIKIQGPTD